MKIHVKKKKNAPCANKFFIFFLFILFFLFIFFLFSYFVHLIFCVKNEKVEDHYIQLIIV